MKKMIFSYVGAILFAILLVIFLVFSGCSKKAVEKAATPTEEQEGTFLTTKNLPQFGGKEFFGLLPTDLVGVLASTQVDTLVAPADTVRCVPQKSGTVLVYADPSAPTSAFAYGPDTNGQYVLLGRPSAVKGGKPTLIYEGKDWILLYGGEGIVINPRGSTRILPGWKPKSNPPKKN